jgi:hypothetical protein
MLDLLIAIDVLLFRVITLGRARPGETMSAAAYHGEQTRKIMGRLFRPLIDLLFRYWQHDHCRQSYLWQLEIYSSDGG